MRTPILRLFGLVVVLFVLLVAFTSRWTVFEAKGVCDKPLNHRPLLEELRIRRGAIRAADGTALARSVHGAGDTFQRSYPPSGPFAHAVGYSHPARGLPNTGLEASRNDALVGNTDPLGCGSDTLSTIVDQLRGRIRQGDDVLTTLDPLAQRVALRALAGRRGAVVALDPRTGAIEVMASVPGFDQSRLPRGRGGSSLFNRVTQAGYPPGSTFKTVTAVAAIDSRAYTPLSVVDGSSPITVSGVPLANDNGESFGPIDLTTALTNSVNTVWAQVALRVGRRTMANYMQRFGFYAKPPLDYPSAQRAASGEYSGSRLLAPDSGLIDVGRMGIGQDKLRVTPLQMAMVAAAIADHGRMMVPHMTDRIIDPDGRTVRRIEPRVQSVVMRPSTAAALTEMMKQVVKEGTGTAAALRGIDVAGKTGTAQVGAPGAGLTQPWFIAFAPAQAPRVAVAVTVERTRGGFGGVVAAPIAKAVMESILRHG